jgi:hypothetical protein
VPGDQVLHVRITKCSCDSKDAVNAVVENQATGAGDAASLVLVAALVVVGETKRSTISAEDDTRIAHISRI